MATTKSNEMNLYQKLIEVRKQVTYLKKDKNNPHFNFDYVSGSKTVHALREKMDEFGLLLVPRIINHQITQGKKQILTELEIEYEWINASNPDQALKCKFYAQGLDAGEKGVGKALTYGEKYFLLKFFNIPTDRDDPDGIVYQGQKTTSGGKTKEKGGNSATEKQVTAIYTIASSMYGLCDRETKELVGKYLGKNIDTLKILTMSEASKCIDLLNDEEETYKLMETMKSPVPPEPEINNQNAESKAYQDDLPF